MAQKTDELQDILQVNIFERPDKVALIDEISNRMANTLHKNRIDGISNTNVFNSGDQTRFYTL